MENIFAINDKTGRIIYLSKERWKHVIIAHPDMTNYLEDIKENLLNPIKIYKDNNVYKYYRHLKHRKHPVKYLRVIVKYLNEHGFIITAHFIKNIR